MVVLGGGAVSYARGTPVVTLLALLQLLAVAATQGATSSPTPLHKSEFQTQRFSLKLIRGLSLFLFITLKPRVERYKSL